MNLMLERSDYRVDGIFGDITDTNGNYVCVTLEHAFPVQPDGPVSSNTVYAPKIPAGTYTCVRGKHELDHDPEPFETFEVTGVAGHTGLLFHWGNWNKDSDGCVLLGLSIMDTGTLHMVTNSKLAFQQFMALQQGVDSFTISFF